MQISVDRAVVLDEATWQVRRERHEARVDVWVDPHLERRRRREKHPVEDFVFVPLCTTSY